MPGLTLDVFLVRSSFRGLWREDAWISGEDGGSFFTIIFGGPPSRDEFGEALAGVEFGLPLPVRCAAVAAAIFGVTETGVLCAGAGGEFDGLDDGAMSTYDALS